MRYLVSFHIDSQNGNLWWEDAGLNTTIVEHDVPWKALIQAITDRHNARSTDPQEQFSFNQVCFLLFGQEFEDEDYDSDTYIYASVFNLDTGTIEQAHLPHVQLRLLHERRKSLCAALDSLETITRPALPLAVCSQELQARLRGAMEHLDALKSHYAVQLRDSETEEHNIRTSMRDVLDSGKRAHDSYGQWIR